KTAPVVSMTIDLEEPEPLALVVVRPTDTHGTTVAVSSSTDGRTWQTVGRIDSRLFNTEPVALVPPSGMSARYLRLTPNADQSLEQPTTTLLPDDPFASAKPVPRDRRALVADYRGDLASIAEVSVWPGRPAPPVTSAHPGS